MGNPMTYKYSISKDFPGGIINEDKLSIAIANSSIVTPLQEMDSNGDEIDIIFTDVLSEADKQTLDGGQASPAGGLIASTDSSPWPAPVSLVELGSLIKANLNFVGDQGIFILPTKYVIRRISILNASGPVGSQVTGGIFSGRKGAGTVIVPANQSYSALKDPTTVLDLTLAPSLSAQLLTKRQLFLSLLGAQGVPVTADIHIFGEDYSQD